MIDLNAIANGPCEAACAICKGHGFYGTPGRRCTFCDGEGRVKWRSRRVEDQPLTSTPIEDQKTAEMIRNVMSKADKYWEASTAARYRVRAELEQVVRAALGVTGTQTALAELDAEVDDLVLGICDTPAACATYAASIKALLRRTRGVAVVAQPEATAALRLVTDALREALTGGKVKARDAAKALKAADAILDPNRPVRDMVKRLAADGVQGTLKSGWHPIETAPKDGSWVIVKGHIANAPPDTMMWNDGGWRNGYDGLDHEPTHWAPLPPWRAGHFEGGFLMAYILSFDCAGEDGHTIDCPDLVAVRGELEGDYFNGDEIEDAMQVLTRDGVWHGEGESIKLYMQCGTRGVLGTLKETHEQTAKEDTRAHEVLRNEAEVRDFGAGAGSVAPGSLGLHASLQVPQVWEVSLRAPEPSKAQANEVLTGTPGVKVPAPAGHILSPPSEEEAEAESLLDHLAACRDAFPLPEPGTPLEQLWAAAMGDPHCVAAYVKAAAGVTKDRHQTFSKAHADDEGN